MGYESWIKLEHTTPNKPEIFRMAKILGIDPDEVLGKAIRFWMWADQNTEDCNAFVTDFCYIDRIVHCNGFGEAMAQVGWLVKEGDSIIIPKFDRHNSQTAKKRANTLRRVKSHRACNASVTLAALQNEEKKVTPSLSMSMSMSSSVDSSEGGVGETSKPEDFVGPIQEPRHEPLPDPLEDFDGETPKHARHFWQLFCGQYHGRSPLRNIHSEASHRELRHFAKAIHIHGDKAVKTLTAYYAKPPREDKALNAYQIVCKLGLNASANAPPPWEAAKQKEKTDGMELLRKAVLGDGK